MIYVRIELWPMGSRARARCLQEGIIYNVGGSHKSGDYSYRLSKVGGFKCSDAQIATGQVKNVLRQGSITGFPRLRLYAHDLLLRALLLAFGDRIGWGSGESDPGFDKREGYQYGEDALEQGRFGWELAQQTIKANEPFRGPNGYDS